MDRIFEVKSPAQLKEYESWLGRKQIQEIVSKANHLLNQGCRVAVLLQEQDILGMDCDGPFEDRQYRLQGINSMTPEAIEAMGYASFDYDWRVSD